MLDTHVGGVKQPNPSLLQLHQQTGKPNKVVCKLLRGMAQKLNIQHTSLYSKQCSKTPLVCCATKNMTLLFLYNINKLFCLCHTYFPNALLYLLNKQDKQNTVML